MKTYNHNIVLRQRKRVLCIIHRIHFLYSKMGKSCRRRRKYLWKRKWFHYWSQVLWCWNHARWQMRQIFLTRKWSSRACKAQGILWRQKQWGRLQRRQEILQNPGHRSCSGYAGWAFYAAVGSIRHYQGKSQWWNLHIGCKYVCEYVVSGRSGTRKKCLKDRNRGILQWHRTEKDQFSRWPYICRWWSFLVLWRSGRRTETSQKYYQHRKKGF